jgi:hypothetical protein
MSDSPPTRRIQGLQPTRALDLSRLVAANRPAATAAPGAVAEAAPTTTLRAVPDAQPQAQPAATVSKAKPAERKKARPATQPSRRAPGAADGAVTPKRPVNIYLSDDVRQRGQDAFRATQFVEGDGSWSEFVERAVLQEAQRREIAHNNGKPFTATGESPGGRLPAGRPLKR